MSQGTGRLWCCVVPELCHPAAATAHRPLYLPTPQRGSPHHHPTKAGQRPDQMMVLDGGRRFSGRSPTTPFVPPDGESRFPLCRLQWCSGAVVRTAVPCLALQLRATLQHCS